MNRTGLKRWLQEWWLLLVPAVFASGAVFAYALTFRALPATENPSAWGTFGDYIGGLMNPLISVLTLFVALNVWRLQKVELELARNEMAQTKLAMEDQARTAEQQRREQRFFDFLNIYTTTLDSISFTDTSDGKSLTHIGKHAFRFLATSYRTPLSGIKHIFEQQSEWNNYLAPESEPNNIDTEWGAVSPTLDHYFRTVCVVLKELELHFLDKEERKRYIKLFRTQLSRDELNLIAMHLLFGPEGKRMQPYVNNSGLLKHMPPSFLRELAERELDSRSFGDEWANITRHP